MPRLLRFVDTTIDREEYSVLSSVYLFLSLLLFRIGVQYIFFLRICPSNGEAMCTRVDFAQGVQQHNDDHVNNVEGGGCSCAPHTEHSEGCNADFGPKLLFVTSVLKINDGRQQNDSM